MAKTVVGLFDERAQAQAAVGDLIQQGFPKESISMVATHEAPKEDRDSVAEHGNAAVESAAVGAGIGATLGGLGGLLLGMGIFVIPGLGPLVAAGAIATTLAGAAAGAATGGLVGALAGMGIPREEADYYAEGVRRGGTLLTVSAGDATAETAADTMRRHNAINVKQRAESWRDRGWPGYDSNAPAYNTVDAERERALYKARTQPVAAHQAVAERPQVEASAAPPKIGDYGDYESEFRRDFETRLANTGLNYDRHAPAYRYGYFLASDPGYRDRDWDSVERSARAYWEERNPGTWDQFRSAIRYAWDRVRGYS